MTLMLTFQTDVKCCARCQQDHPKLEFKKIENYKFATHYALCPTNGQPIMMNVKETASKRRSRFRPSLTPGFDRFWAMYPKKEAKVSVEKKWAQLTSPEIEAILVALQWQIKTEKWMEGFAPNPLTYLNQKRWMDEPSAPVNKGLHSSQVFNAPKGPTAAELKALNK